MKNLFCIFTLLLTFLVTHASMEAQSTNQFTADTKTNTIKNATYFGIWQKGTNKYKVDIAHSWNSFTKKWGELAKANYRLTDVEIDVRDGKQIYTATYEPGKYGYSLYSINNWDKFVANWKKSSNQGLRLIDFETHEYEGRTYYTGVYRQGTGKYYLWRISDYKNFTNKANELKKKGYSLIDVEVDRIGDHTFYTGVWRSGKGSILVKTGSISDKIDEMEAQNYRLVDLEQYIDRMTSQPTPHVGGTHVGRSGSGSVTVPTYPSKPIYDYLCIFVPSDGGYYVYADKHLYKIEEKVRHLNQYDYQLIELEPFIDFKIDKGYRYKETETISTTGSESGNSNVWQGSWNTSYGELRLHQQGNKVYGDYANRGNIDATYNPTNNKLTGKFTNGSKEGTFTFTLAGNKFTGTWKWSTGGGKWTGTKKSSSKPTLTTYKPSGSTVDGNSNVWQGSWNTSYGELRLHQNGNKVYGDYANVGTIEANYNPNNKTLTGTFTNKSKKGTFSFQRNGNEFTGTWKWTDGGGKWTGTKKSSSKPTLTNDKSPVSKPTSGTSNVWQGSWNTTYGELRLHQNGNKVFGDYDNKGTIEADYNPNNKTLTGEFTNGNREGTFNFQMNGNSFSGTWKWSTGGGKWTGTKKSTSKPTLTKYKSSGTKPTIGRTKPSSRPTAVLLDSIRGWDDYAYEPKKRNSFASMAVFNGRKTVLHIGSPNREFKVDRTLELSSSDNIRGWSWDGKTASYLVVENGRTYVHIRPFDGYAFGQHRAVSISSNDSMLAWSWNGNNAYYFQMRSGKVEGFRVSFDGQSFSQEKPYNNNGFSNLKLRGFSTERYADYTYYHYENGKSHYRSVVFPR